MWSDSIFSSYNRIFGVAFSDQTLQQEINNQLQDNMEDYDWNI